MAASIAPAAESEPADAAAQRPAMTPMMAQYFELKAKAGDCLLFYRMGDFFELFFDDARAAAATLDIALTSRGEHGGVPIPMCGVPVHSAEAYLARLIRGGHRVAIAEQTETPAQAKARGGSKALVARGIVRYVTPGTLTEDTLLDARADNMLVAIGEAGGDLGLAAADISTGRFEAMTIDPGSLAAELALCWIHEGRHYKKLTPWVAAHRDTLDTFVEDFWDFYDALLVYRHQPTADERTRLSAAFDTLFATTTDYWALNERIAKTRGRAFELQFIRVLQALGRRGKPEDAQVEPLPERREHGTELGHRQAVLRHEIGGGRGVTLQFLADGAVMGAMLGLGAIGVTLTYSILRFANFAHGEFITWGA